MSIEVQIQIWRPACALEVTGLPSLKQLGTAWSAAAAAVHLGAGSPKLSSLLAIAYSKLLDALLR